MKININGRDKDLSILYGNTVVFSYESVIEMAGMNPNLGEFSVTYSEGDNHGTLKPLQKVEFRNNLYPIFNVAES